MSQLRVAVAAIALSACSLTALDGYSGGGAADASDASSSPDVAVDASPARFCATRSSLVVACADFEDGVVPSAWKAEATSGTDVSVDDQGSASPHALNLAVPASGAFDATCILHPLLGTRTALTIEAEVRVDEVGGGDFDVFTVKGDANIAEIGVSVMAGQLRIEEDLDENGKRVEESSLATQALGATYARVRLSSELGATGAHTELFVNGTRVATRDANAAVLAGDRRVEIGDCALVGARSWRLHVDNVVIESR